MRLRLAPVCYARESDDVTEDRSSSCASTASPRRNPANSEASSTRLIGAGRGRSGRPNPMPGRTMVGWVVAPVAGLRISVLRRTPGGVHSPQSLSRGIAIRQGDQRTISTTQRAQTAHIASEFGQRFAEIPDRRFTKRENHPRSPRVGFPPRGHHEKHRPHPHRAPSNCGTRPTRSRSSPRCRAGPCRLRRGGPGRGPFGSC